METLGTAAGSGTGPGTGAAGRPDLDALAVTFEAVVANVASVYLGSPSVIRLALACLMAEGHLLVEDLPGVGKTTLAKALAHSLGLTFRRIQFTSDLLPADVAGAMVFDRDSGQLVFRPGPVFTNVLLADELNRASPKSQSALLEAMEERQVTTDGVSHALPRPFMVLATQNPYDAAGTFPLPHSQRDRFLLRVSLGYPTRAQEDRILGEEGSRPLVDNLPAVCGADFVSAFRAASRAVHLSAVVRGYVLDLAEATRNHPDLAVGASPRAALGLIHAASAVAVAQGRDYVTPDDVKLTAEAALAHRLVVHSAAELAGLSASRLVDDILGRLPVPLGAG